MTDTPSSPNEPEDDDLLASLYLDGEATPQERARVEADPALMARVQDFQALAADLASITPPPDLRRTQISAALDLFDQQHSGATSPAGAAAPVASLAERRDKKQARSLPSWLGAAAAAVLVVGGIGFATTLGGGDSDDASTDAAMEASDDVAASSTNRVLDEASETAESAGEAESVMADEAMDDDAMELDAAEADAMEDGAADEAVEESDTGDDADADTTAAPPTTAADSGDVEGISPIPLDDLEAATATEYFELLGDQPLQPIANSPCAGSPLVEGLFGVDSFVAVVFDGVPSSLLVQAGVPSTAVIVGPTCEIELE